MARRQPALDADALAALQPLCEFDLAARPLEWARYRLLSYAQEFSRQGVDMRTADMGISFRLDGSDAKDRKLLAVGSGHPRAPLRVETLDPQNAWRWITALARRHRDCERIIALGDDPASPRASSVIADPCLVREAARHGLTPGDLVRVIPVIGEVVLGAGWRSAKGHPRTVDAGGLQAHVVRDVGRIRLVRLGFGAVGGYEPPDPDVTRSGGALTLLRTQLPDTLKGALTGQPLSRLVDIPSLDAGATIRSIGRSGGSLVARLGGCEAAAPMA